MPANDELARGWQFFSQVAGGTALITVPGVVGIAHVLSAAHWELVNSGPGAAFGCFIDFYVNGVAVRRVSNPQLDAVIGAVAGDWSGKIQGGLGQSIAVQFSVACPAAYSELLTIQGYDV